MPLVEVRHLSKRFLRRDGLFGRPSVVHAVRDVSFSVEVGETFGLVGESGSGKTTTARCVLRLVPATSGDVLFRGEQVLAAAPARMRELRRQMQVVFQDPHGSLDPRMRVGRIVAEPLDIHRVGTRVDRAHRVAELLALVGLDPALASRVPAELSGGQRQRVALARALALEPAFVVADEPVSALDVSVQAQVLNLLMDLQARLNLTYLLIAHDLRLVRHVCHRLAVMFQGRIVETGPSDAVFTNAMHPYTRALLSAVPVPDPTVIPRRMTYSPEPAWDELPLRPVGQGHWAAVE